LPKDVTQPFHYDYGTPRGQFTYSGTKPKCDCDGCWIGCLACMHCSTKGAIGC
jgi:hypothetical protein